MDLRIENIEKIEDSMLPYAHWLYSINGVGSKTIRYMLTQAGTPEALYRMPKEKIESVLPHSNRKPELAEKIAVSAAESGTVFGYLTEEAEDAVSVLDIIGGAICWIFAPLGFGNETAAVATIMGLVAKEEVVGVFGVLDFAALTPLAGYSFLIFNLLCAPCFAAIGAIKREMNSAKWTWFAIGYQCVFAYVISLIVYQLGSLFVGSGNVLGIIFAVLFVGFIIFMLAKPYKEADKLTAKEAEKFTAKVK